MLRRLKDALTYAAFAYVATHALRGFAAIGRDIVETRKLKKQIAQRQSNREL